MTQMHTRALCLTPVVFVRPAHARGVCGEGRIAGLASLPPLPIARLLHAGLRVRSRARLLRPRTCMCVAGLDWTGFKNLGHSLLVAAAAALPRNSRFSSNAKVSLLLSFIYHIIQGSDPVNLVIENRSALRCRRTSTSHKHKRIPTRAAAPGRPSPNHHHHRQPNPSSNSVHYLV